MTNLELNIELAKLVYPTNDWTQYLDGNSVTNSNGCILNYIDTWDSLMELVIEHLGHFLILQETDGIHYADCRFYMKVIQGIGDSPQLALCHCLIKVLQKKEKAE